jgi:hypothetical protein
MYVQGGKEAGTGVVNKSTLVNQQLRPGEFNYAGQDWRSLGFYVPDGDTLMISVHTFSVLGGFALGEVVADAVMVVGDWYYTDVMDSGSVVTLLQGPINPPFPGYDADPAILLLAKHGNLYQFDQHGVLRATSIAIRIKRNTTTSTPTATDWLTSVQDQQGNVCWNYLYEGGTRLSDRDFANRETVLKWSMAKFATTEPDPGPDGDARSAASPMLAKSRGCKSWRATATDDHRIWCGHVARQSSDQCRRAPRGADPFLVDGLATTQQSGQGPQARNGADGRARRSWFPPVPLT